MADRAQNQDCQEITGEQDNELDELLDSALEDFSKTETSHKPKDAAPITPEQSTGTERKSGDNDTLFEEIFGKADDNPDPEKLEETVKKLLGGNEELMRQLNQFTEAAAAAGNMQGETGADLSMADLEMRLRRTMEDMAKNTKDIGEADVDDDFLRAMSDLGLGGSDEGGGTDFIQVMQGMMQNLLSKDVLYPALKELNQKYPAWLEAKKNILVKEEYTRYSKQYELVQQICQEYESDNPQESEEEKSRRFNKMMDLMQKMQESGNPPPELLNENPISPPEQVPLDLPPVKPGEECKPM